MSGGSREYCFSCFKLRNLCEIPSAQVKFIYLTAAVGCLDFGWLLKEINGVTG